MIETVDRNGDGRISYSEFRSGAVGRSRFFFVSGAGALRRLRLRVHFHPKKIKRNFKKYLNIVNLQLTLLTKFPLPVHCAIFDRSRLITTSRKQGFFEVIEHNSLKKSKMSLLHQKPELEPGSDPGIDRNQAGSAILESCFRPTVDQTIQKNFFPVFNKFA